MISLSGSYYWIENDPIYHTPQTDVSNDCLAVTKIAIKAIGLILIAAGIGCLTATLQVPTIALLIAGVAALFLGSALDTNKQVNDIPTPEMAFGREKWIQHIKEDPGVVPSLPANIEEILASQCQFWPEKTVAETHMLVLIPKLRPAKVSRNRGDGTYNTSSLPLPTLHKMIKCANNGTGIGFGYVWTALLEAEEDLLMENSHWVLMTKDVIPESRGMDYDAQKQLVENAGYEIPSHFDAATAILLENISSGTRLFSDNPSTYTRCNEKVVVVGGFDSHGLQILYRLKSTVAEALGVAALRKFF